MIYNEKQRATESSKMCISMAKMIHAMLFVGQFAMQRLISKVLNLVLRRGGGRNNPVEFSPRFSKTRRNGEKLLQVLSFICKVVMAYLERQKQWSRNSK